jgi:hypothetical protein
VETKTINLLILILVFTAWRYWGKFFFFLTFLLLLSFRTDGVIEARGRILQSDEKAKLGVSCMHERTRAAKKDYNV